MYQSASRSPRPRLEIAAAVGLIVAALLPFGTISVGGSGDQAFPNMSFSSSFTLGDVIGDSPDALAQLAALLVVAGGACAVIAAFYRAIQPWPGAGSAAACLLGFGAFAAGSVLVLVAVDREMSSTSAGFGISMGLAVSPSLGFAADVFVGIGGFVISAISLGDRSRPPMGVAGAYAGWTTWRGHPAQPYPQPFGPPYPISPFAAAPVPPTGPGGAQLTVLQTGQTYSYQIALGQSLSIGSGADANLRLADPGVSPKQLTVTLTPSGWTIRPADNANPAQVMGPSGIAQPLQGEMAHPACQILIGSTLLTLGPLAAS